MFTKKTKFNLIFFLAVFLFQLKVTAQKIPDWFLKDMESLIGTWLTSNEKYKSENEPYDSYGVEWKWGIGKTSMTGRLFGIKDNKEIGDFWQYRQYWDAEKNEGVLIQFGYNGTKGEGPIKLLSDGKTESIQSFSSPGAKTWGLKHISFIEDNVHTTISYNKNEKGEWQLNRTYKWEKKQGSSASSDGAYQLYLTNIAAAEAFFQLNKISVAKNYLDACDKKYRGIEWNFLNGSLDQSSNTIRKGNVSGFTAVEFSPDNKLLAVSGSDSVILLYSYPEKKVIRELKGHKASVSTLDFSPDGKKLASGGRDHAVIIWDVATGKQIAKNDQSFSQGIYQVRFSHDNSLLGVVTWELVKGTRSTVNGFMKLLDANSGTELKKINTEPHPAAGVVFTNDDKSIIVSTWGEITYSYDVSSGKTNWAYDLSDAAEYNAFHSIDISPDGKTVALGSTDHRIHLLNVADGKLIRRIEPWDGHTKTVKAVKFTDDGKWLSSGGEDQTILIFNTDGYTEKRSLKGHTHTVTGLAWTSDGTKLFSSSQDGSVKEWNILNPFAKEYEICNFGPWQSPFTADKKYFAAPCSDSNLVVYEVATGKPFMKFAKQSGLCGDISEDSKWLVTSSFDGVVRLWDIKTGKEAKTLKGHTSRVDGVAYMNSKNYILSVGDSTLRVWSQQSAQPVKTISFNKAPFRIVLHPDESVVYVSFSGGIIKKLSTKTWTEVDSLKCESGITEMTVSSDGKLLAAFSGRNIEVWDLQTFKRKWKLEGHEQGGYGIGISPDNRYAISGSYDQTFKIWDLSNGTCTLTYHGYQDIVYSCKILSGNEIFIGSSQGKIWHYKF